MSFVALALCAAVAFGTADFLGGLTSQRIPAAAGGPVEQAGGRRRPGAARGAARRGPGGRGLAWAVAAGVVGIAAATALYAALASGPMSLVAPLTACSALLPAGVALAGGETAGLLTLAGMVAALAGAVLVTRPAPGGPPRR
jgi:drug/metabolite transporter (DMT)-like permease